MPRGGSRTGSGRPRGARNRRTAELIGKRWNPQVIRALQTGSARFGDMKSAIPHISDALLSDRLKELEAIGGHNARLDSLRLAEYRLYDAKADLAGAQRNDEKKATSW